MQHVDERAFYALDRLWKDCPTVEIEGVQTRVRPVSDDDVDDALAPEEPRRDEGL